MGTGQRKRLAIDESEKKIELKHVQLCGANTRRRSGPAWKVERPVQVQLEVSKTDGSGNRDGRRRGMRMS